MKNKLTGVLMAAGIGKRLGAGTTKALVEIEGRPLAFYAIDFLRDLGADKIIVIGGCDFERLKEKIKNYDDSIEILNNPDYLKGNLYTLMRALPNIDGSFIVCNADHIYKKAIAKKVKSQLFGITAFADFDRELGDDDMKIWHNEKRLIHISKQLSEFNGGYVGLTYCDACRLDEYKKFANNLLEKGEENAVVENIVRDLAGGKEGVCVGDISGHGWLEIDFPKELKRARQEIDRKKEEYFI